MMRARCGAWRTRIGGARAARSRITSAGRARLAPLRAAAGSFAASDEGLVTEFLAQSGDFVVFVVDGTKVCNRAALVHTTSPTATHALGRVLMGTTLIGASKGSQVQVTFKGNGALGQIMAISEGEYIKARLDNAIIENDVESIVATGARVGHAVGKQGVLTVVRKNTELGQYTGQQSMGITELASGEVGEDLAKYLAESEQINSAIGLGLVLGRNFGEEPVTAAGGYLVQMLPGASEETLARLEQNIGDMAPVSQLLSEGKGAEEVAAILAEGMSGGVVRCDERVLRYGPCNTADLSQRMVNTLKLLPVTEIRSILEEQGQVEMQCDFCKELVQFSEEDLVQEGVIGK